LSSISKDAGVASSVIRSPSYKNRILATSLPNPAANAVPSLDRSYLCPLPSCKHLDMSDEEQQAPPQTQDEVKTENPDTINVKVVTSSGEEVFFKIKRNTKLSKLQGAYAAKVGKDVASIRFLYEGDRITEDATPASLEMEDNDTIDVMVEQVGGSTVFS